MAGTTSSAQPDKLFQYADLGTRMDQEMVIESLRLGARLSHFASTCTENVCQVGVEYLADVLRSYGSQVEETDSWVRRVGLGFRQADQLLVSTRVQEPSNGIRITKPKGMFSLPDWFLEWIRKFFHRDEQDSIPGDQSSTGRSYPEDPNGPIVVDKPRGMIVLPDWLLEWLRKPFHRDHNQSPPDMQVSEMTTSEDSDTRIYVQTPRGMIALSIWFLEWIRKVFGIQKQTGELEKEVVDSEEEQFPDDSSPANSSLEQEQTRPFIERRHLQQAYPQGDPDVLRVERFESNMTQESIGWDIPSDQGGVTKKRTIETVQDHIAAFGCMMTCYTMLLQDKGADVSVTDIYEALYTRNNHSDLKTDAANNNNTIKLNNLYLSPDDVNNAAEKCGDPQLKAAGGSLEGATVDEKKTSLREQIDRYGSVVVHVAGLSSDGHWIVIDGYDQYGSFSVRDPAESSAISKATFGDTLENTYRFASDLEFKYIREQQALNPST